MPGLIGPNTAIRQRLRESSDHRLDNRATYPCQHGRSRPRTFCFSHGSFIAAGAATDATHCSGEKRRARCSGLA